MTFGYIIILTFILTVIFLFLRMPVGISLLLGGLIGLFLLYKQNAFLIVPQQLFNSLNSFVLIALPLFMLMGVILAKGGIGERLYDIFDVFLGHIPGGVGVGTILTCMLLSAMMGSSVAVAATVAPFAIKNLRKLGYSMPLAAGAVAGGGALGILIPPSGVMILFGAMTGESIGRLFMAGMFPGILTGLMFCGYMIFSFRGQKGVQVKTPASWTERWRSLKRGYWGILIPLGIIVSIYTGIATATEAAAVGCLLAIIATCFFHRTLSWKDFLPLLHQGVISITSILLIIAGAVVFGAFVIQSGFSAAIAEFFTIHNIALWGFLAITMIIMLIEGCFLEGAAICLIMVPILHPAVLSYGFSLITYAVLLTINIECALLTPPVGLNLFVVNNLCKAQGLTCTLEEVIKGVIPYFFLYILTMILVMLFPFLSLWLPNHMIGG
jgi:C4-dicarboxylate transporter DctM subunit